MGVFFVQSRFGHPSQIVKACSFQNRLTPCWPNRSANAIVICAVACRFSVLCTVRLNNQAPSPASKSPLKSPTENWRRKFEAIKLMTA